MYTGQHHQYFLLSFADVLAILSILGIAAQNLFDYLQSFAHYLSLYISNSICQTLSILTPVISPIDNTLLAKSSRFAFITLLTFDP